MIPYGSSLPTLSTSVCPRTTIFVRLSHINTSPQRHDVAGVLLFNSQLRILSAGVPSESSLLLNIIRYLCLRDHRAPIYQFSEFSDVLHVSVTRFNFFFWKTPWSWYARWNFRKAMGNVSALAGGQTPSIRSRPRRVIGFINHYKCC